MKGDFSRNTFDRTKHYAGVLMQQGRVQTDADWNEQWAIDEYRETTTSTDVIGKCGAPMDDAGFALVSNGQTLTIGAGRFYVDGILVENDATVEFAKQPHLPNPPNIGELLEQAKTTAGVAYLDVWLRHVTALDEPRLREVALGGPDTTTRAQVIWQVKVLPVSAPDEDSENCADLRAARVTLEETIKKLQDTDASPERLAVVQKRLDEVNQRLAAECGSGACGSSFKEWDELIAARNVTLNARTVPPSEDDNPCLLPPSAGYQRLENQLYRVEIHQGGTLTAGGGGSVTFKASRDNGTVVTLIEKLSGQEVTVRDVGPDDVLGFANGQWVEVVDDALELNGLPGELIQIDQVNAATRVIRLKAAPTLNFDAALHPKLRRWDTAGALPLTTDWIALEGGIQVQFSQGDYHTGDYWLIPARTATGEIEWPPFAVPNTAPVAQPPLGIVHHYCRLALMRAERDRLDVIEDCRVLFPPLTQVGGKTLAAALHVMGTSWSNDDPFDADRFFKEGLIIQLDAAPEPRSVDEANVIVTLELTPAADTAPVGTFSPLVVLDGTIVRTFDDPNVIVWRPADSLRERLGSILQGAVARLRVTLKGHTIWNEQGAARRYLDGQAFGITGEATPPRKTRIALQFPSGDGARASDFESWFYLGSPRVETKPLQVSRVTFFSVTGAPSSAGVINLPPLPASVEFKAGEQVKVIELQFSRPVRREGLEVGEGPASVRVDLVRRGTLFTPVAGSVKLVNEQTVQFTARNPEIFVAGAYRLRVLGTDQTDAPAVRALDDNSLLDGNYDNVAGQDFVLNFVSR